MSKVASTFKDTHNPTAPPKMDAMPVKKRNFCVQQFYIRGNIAVSSTDANFLPKGVRVGEGLQIYTRSHSGTDSRKNVLHSLFLDSSFLKFSIDMTVVCPYRNNGSPKIFYEAFSPGSYTENRQRCSETIKRETSMFCVSRMLVGQCVPDSLAPERSSHFLWTASTFKEVLLLLLLGSSCLPHSYHRYNTNLCRRFKDLWRLFHCSGETKEKVPCFQRVTEHILF